MTRKSISTNPPVVSCDVCGRTLLRGESADIFLAGGQRRHVCDLCTGRAAHEGWIREGLDDLVTRGQEGRGRRGSLLSRLRTRRPEPLPEPQARWSAPRTPAVEPEYGDESADDLPPVEVPRRPAPPEPAVAAAPDHTLYESRGVHGVPTNAELKVARALELFNASSHVRTVSGVARSLGPPIVSARPSRTEGSVVTIVVAWELSWYRFEVDLGNEAAGVRVTTQGSELDELDELDQTANAAADDHGRLHPAASLA